MGLKFNPTTTDGGQNGTYSESTDGEAAYGEAEGGELIINIKPIKNR